MAQGSTVSPKRGGKKRTRADERVAAGRDTPTGAALKRADRDKEMRGALRR